MKPPAEALAQSCFYSLQSAFPAQSVIGRSARSASALRSHREGIFRKAAFFFLWILIFVIPFENAVVIPGFGTLSRAVGIPAFGMALLAILESGTLRTLSMQHLIVLFFTVWAGLTYFWSFAPSETVDRGLHVCSDIHDALAHLGIRANERTANTPSASLHAGRHDFVRGYPGELFHDHKRLRRPLYGVQF